jgi:predicted XRE-type DNA-binding protein
MSEFVCGLLEMIDSQSANQQAALITHLKITQAKGDHINMDKCSKFPLGNK